MGPTGRAAPTGGTGENIAGARWRILPVGLGPALLRQAQRTAVAILPGLGVLLGTVVVAGLVTEELLNGTETGSTIDLVGRACLAGMLILLVLTVYAIGVLGGLQGPLMARALARCVDADTPPADVPHPAQWEAVTEDTSRGYRVIAIVLLCALGFLHVIVIAAVLESGIDAAGLAIIGAGLLILGVIGAGIPLFGRVLRDRQERTVQRLRAHWTEPHRIVAAGRALGVEDFAAARAADGAAAQPRRGREPEARPGVGGLAGPGALAGAETLPGATARRVGDMAVNVLGAAAAGGLLALQLMFALAYPARERWPGGQAGERADLDASGERLVDLVVVAMAVCAALVLLCLGLAVACQILAHRAEQRTVHAALADLDGPPPARALLQGLLAPSTPRLLVVVHALAGAVAAAALGLWVVPIEQDSSDWSYYSDASPVLRALDQSAPVVLLLALAVLAAGTLLAALLDRREQPLRDQLVQRWPVRAEPDEEPSEA